MNKKYKKWLIGTIICFTTTYLIIAFVTLKLNPADWEMGVRILLAAIGAIALVFVVAICEIKDILARPVIIN